MEPLASGSFLPYRELFSGLVNRIMIGAIIAFTGFIVARILSKLLRKVLKNFYIDELCKKCTRIKISIVDLIYHFAQYAMDILVILITLSYLGIAREVLSLLAAVLIIVLAAFILLSVKDFIPNLISGIYLHQRGQLKKGDIVEFSGLAGKITEESLVETKIETKSGDTIIIPNSNFTKGQYTKKKRM